MLTHPSQNSLAFILVYKAEWLAKTVFSGIPSLGLAFWVGMWDLWLKHGSSSDRRPQGHHLLVSGRVPRAWRKTSHWCSVIVFWVTSGNPGLVLDWFTEWGEEEEEDIGSVWFSTLTVMTWRHIMFSAWFLCAFSLGYPHWSWQLCDQPLVWFSSFINCGRAGWRLHPRVWQEDGSEWMVTTHPSQAQWGAHISSSFPSKHSSVCSSAVSWPTESTQPGWWKRTCRNIQKATSWVSGKRDFTVWAVFS